MLGSVVWACCLNADSLLLAWPGSCSAARAGSWSPCTFRDVGSECKVMPAHLVHDPLDPVDRWSVLWLIEYLSQCSSWPNGCANAKCSEDVAQVIGRNLHIRDPVVSLSCDCLHGSGLVAKAFPKQITRSHLLLSHLKRVPAHSGRRLALLRSVLTTASRVALDCETQNQGICLCGLLYCKHQPLRNCHPARLFVSPERENSDPCQSAPLYCELDATINGVQMLVEKV